MYSLVWFLFLTGAICHTVVSEPYGKPVVHETTDDIPEGWTYHSHEVADDDYVTLHIALAELNDAYLEVATAVSDPDSPRYGQYLSANELRELVNDHSSSSFTRADAVKDWLYSSGAKDVTLEREWIHFSTQLEQASRMLSTKFHQYSYQNENPVYRAKSYSVPSNLTKHIDFIYPVTQFLRPFTTRKPSTRAISARQVVPTGPPTCNNSICPEEIRKKYNINYSPPDSKSGSQIGIAGFLSQYANHNDSRYFLTHYAKVDKIPPDFHVQLVNGGKNPQNESLSGTEAMLDVEYIQSFSGQLNVTFFSTGGRPPTLNSRGTKPVSAKVSQNEPFLALLEHLLSMDKPPQVISISYSDTEQTVPIKYAQKVCSYFARLATRGVSVIGSSGDGGAEGTGNSNCKRPDGSTMFLPTFPSSCPWYTSVGGVAGYGGAASLSSGGFSNYFKVPSWQKAATSAYIKEIGKKHAGYYNVSGRGIPDVSALADDYLIWQGGVPSSHDGTSAGTPVFASIIALLNDLRLRAGKPALGFLNPMLYTAKVTATFTDVKTGQSNGCANDTGFEAGWKAVKGWDPTTGIGTPDFVKLRAVLV